ncbi:MAG: response regulator [Candidatus Manganitrophaceae bacterium]|nr:MAG: response regulator [Candidatus Manganitrophaceae bacterium]
MGLRSSKTNPLVRRKTAAPSREWLVGGGEMGRLIRMHDWSATPLGPRGRWPQSLQTAIRIILGSRYPMFVWWGSAFIKFYNDAYIPVLGKRHPDALGQPAARVWAEIWPILGPQAEAVINEGRATWNEELLLVMERNGYTEETYFTFSYSPVANDAGEVNGVFCACTEETGRVIDRRRLKTLRDLTARTAEAKTAEEACELAARALAQNPHDLPFALIYLLNHDGTRAHLAGCAGIAPQAAASPEAIEAGSMAPNRWPLDSIARSEGMQLDDLAARFGPLPGGPWPESPRSAVLLPLAQPGQKQPAGLLIAGISPRRLLDDNYRDFLDLVAGHVATAVANARAYETERKRAEALAEIDRAKTAFFSNVSHEFRTPLTLMLGPIEDALADLRRPLAPEHRERLITAHRNSLRLLKLVNTLLDFSRLEADRMEATYEPTDLAALTAELASTFRSAIDRAGLRLIVNCPLLEEPIYVDREMWEKIVLNLISNAFKFTFEGEIEVALRRAADQIELRVRDTGTGIPEEALPHLFERFYQVKGARARTHEGSGIGLALVQDLVRLHGGTTCVESAVGRGTTFTVAIPAGAAHLPSDRIGGARMRDSTALGAASYVEEALRWLPERRNEEAPLGGPPQAPLHVPRPARILLADDNADMREYLRRLLSQKWTVEAVGDGAAAFTAACGRPPDLLLTDVMMPGMDGFELLQALRADSRTREVPVILLSARAGEESRVEGLEAGADDYLVKPFSARELMARVGAHLELAHLRREALRNERQRRLEAEELSRMKTQFFSSVSHDLRTPLNAIVGYIHLLSNETYGPVAEPQKMPLDGIRRNVRELLKLIDDVLHLARIDSGKMPVARSSVRLSSIIKEMAVEMKPLLEAKSLSLQLRIPENFPEIESDATKVKQVLTNLLSNAIKFTNQGGVVMEIKDLPEEGGVEIAVSDTGTGIEPEFLPKIFESFYQIEESRASGGSGLGLAIVKELVSLLHGKVRVASEFGKGSTFTVFLPHRFSTE